MIRPVKEILEARNSVAGFVLEPEVRWYSQTGSSSIHLSRVLTSNLKVGT